MLILELTISLGAALMLLIMQNNPLAMWISTALFGLGMSAIFPTIMALSENYVVLTGRYAAAMVFGAALGEMVLPLLIGFTTTKESPSSFSIIVLVIMIACSLASIALIFAGRKAGDEYESEEEDDLPSTEKKQKPQVVPLDTET